MFKPVPFKIPIESSHGELFEKAYVSDDGFMSHEVERNCCGKLPPVQNFSLEKIVKAGLPLEEISTVIREPSSFDGSFLDDSSDSVTENENSNVEVENEK